MKKLFAALVLLTCVSAGAQNFDAFEAGKTIPTFGKIAAVADADLVIPPDMEFRVAFDVGKQSDPGQINRTLDSAARFINMHVEAGVAKENIHVAVVVHGSAALDLTRHEVYRKLHGGKDNANVDALNALMDNNTEIYLCGQTAAYRGVGKDDLVPGVKLALSAMTAHAWLLQHNYTPNPF